MRLLLIFCTAFCLMLGGIANAEVASKSFQDVLNRATLEPTETLQYGAAEPQFIELFLPQQTQPAPLVVFVHGGCWLNSFSVSHGRGLAEGLVQAGYAVAAIEYRRLDDEGGGWPGTLNDVVHAVHYLTSQPQANDANQNVVLVGHSAGGHLALLAAHPQYGLPLAGVVGLAAITDIVRYASGSSGCQQAAARFVASAPAGTNTMQFNPAEQQLSLPVHLLLGSADTIVGNEQQLNGATFTALEGAGHFDVIHPDTHAFQALLNALNSLWNSNE